MARGAATTTLSLLALASRAVEGLVPSSCAWDSKRGASFDLSRLTKADGTSWEILDTDPETNDFLYVFNICADVGAPPMTWNATASTYSGHGCRSTTGGQGRYIDAPSAAYQLAHNEARRPERGCGGCACRARSAPPTGGPTRRRRRQLSCLCPCLLLAQQRDGFCYHLNDGFSNGNFSLFSEADPSAGVVLTYLGGDRCGGPGGVARSLR